ncbi:MAG: hypothetical protein D6753_05430 [Planctomycetota bacterium]|nr:MAG: hypothetical protein D6753_05430 [Planctomycetota bacterium]
MPYSASIARVDLFRLTYNKSTIGRRKCRGSDPAGMRPTRVVRRFRLAACSVRPYNVRVVVGYAIFVSTSSSDLMECTAL